MSRAEQAALVAYLNTFKLSRPVTAFKDLSDGKALMEVMASIDSTHFKNVSNRTPAPTASGSAENWVLRMNTLKRLYRLLLSFPLPPPHAANLSLSNLPEPPFPTIAKAPSTSEGLKGLAQICRICLAVGVWAPGNEQVIAKIQGLRESHMAELMKSIEEVMATLPQEEGADDEIYSPFGTSPIKQSTDFSCRPPPSGIRQERDKLLQDNDELRARCEKMLEQVEGLTSNLDEVKGERDDALEQLAAARADPSAQGTGLRTSQTAATAELDRLRTDLGKAEDSLAHTESALEKQTNLVSELTKTVEELKEQAAEAVKLRDQVDEYKHAAERLKKSENVIEKYKKKLEESAGLRKDLRNLEEENAQLVNTNASLEADLKKAGSSKGLVDSYKSQIGALEKKSTEQATQISELNHQLEVTRAELDDISREYERDQSQLEAQQERLKEIELGTPGLKRQGSRISVMGSKTTLDDELGVVDEDGDGKVDTKTELDSLRLKIRSLQRELADLRSGSGAGDTGKLATLETLLADANKSKDKYQSDYLQEHRSLLRLQATMERIRAGHGGDHSQTASALRERLNEVLEERDALLKEKEASEVAREVVDKELAIAKTDLGLVDKDQKAILTSLRETVKEDTVKLENEIGVLKEQVQALREKDHQHLEDIKRLLLEKVDLQSAGIENKERELEKEKEFGDLRASLASKGLPQEIQQQLLSLLSQNSDLSSQVKSLDDKLQKAKMFIKQQDKMFREDHANMESGNFAEASKSYQLQISTLKEDLLKARQNTAALENRYQLEQKLMLSAWHDLGQRTIRDHLNSAGLRRVQKPVASSWLGRQRRMQDEATFAR
ncbi:hypothetical protein L486_04758 [Kwoniella mangroviensis CBS 10435]|uniref:Protein-nucleus import-related protein n=1 Tax=Kwoniella mangroviensis CBS 10435 TaxID=1331196 RepID=A0A1B9IP09_9TREE|nr:hypothetical protein L486_04758 [Kwoniella mangroviensis CBS 10435]